MQRSLSGDEETTGAWEGEFKDKWTGNHITLNYDSLNREVIVAFNGTEDDTTFNSNIGNYLGQVPPSVKQACKVGAAVRDSVRRYNERMQGELGFKSIKVVSVGHSRGGMMAQAEAIRNGGRAVTMNPEPLGFAVRAYVGVHDSSKVKPKTEITNLSVNDEWLSGKSGMRKVGRGLEYAWGGTPMVYGDRLAMDPAPGLTGTKDKHAAFLAHVGYLAGSV